MGLPIGIALGVVFWLLARRRGPLPAASGPLPPEAHTLDDSASATLAWEEKARGSRHTTITIDSSGVRARGRFGLRFASLPLETVTWADVTRIDCLGDFGGWGVRKGFNGSWGLVTRNGEALVVHRAEQCDWVFTVDDAQLAAATLNTLVQRRFTPPATSNARPLRPSR